ncbi:major facilitator superfamily domain-containing protein [Apodospora peruviana]|uniref:Major facilitator superfamily domain-containing protein n=1 Tax=Apodospora peruviana TaxID=516989 RepID=A0AAE0HV92_9PEZI|nr:major facilitator superfamily domain-containing protein [Apodospora peruviana]
MVPTSATEKPVEIPLRHIGKGSPSSSSGRVTSTTLTTTTGIKDPSNSSSGEVSAVQTDIETALEDSRPRNEFQQLPPVDTGKDAWLFLAACFVLECLVWGMLLSLFAQVCASLSSPFFSSVGIPFSFGVFQNYYSIHEPWASSGNTAVIGTCSMGIMYLDTPLIMGLLRRFPRQGRWSPIFGLVIMCLGLALSSFSTTVTHLIITQGVIYAIGGSIAYSPCIIYLDEWFVMRKGLAYGIMWSGTGLAGVILPLLLEYLLSTCGFQTTVRLWACLVFVLTAPLAYYIKPRIPAPLSSSAASTYKPFALRFVLSQKFMLYQLANIVEAVGFFLPAIYLPSYARSTLGASPFPSALTLLLLNVASVFGCVAMGSLIDRWHVTTCILVSTIGATLGTFLLWGFSMNLPVLYIFCLVYGLFAGSFTSTWPGIMREMARERISVSTTTNITGSGANGSNSTNMLVSNDDHGNNGHSGEEYGNNVDPVMVFGFLALGRGVGNVVSGPLSEALVRGAPWQGEAVGGYGSGYGSLIAFTGVTALFGGGSYVWRRLGWL